MQQQMKFRHKQPPAPRWKKALRIGWKIGVALGTVISVFGMVCIYLFILEESIQMCAMSIIPLTSNKMWDEAAEEMESIKPRVYAMAKSMTFWSYFAPNGGAFRAFAEAAVDSIERQEKAINLNLGHLRVGGNVYDPNMVVYVTKHGAYYHPDDSDLVVSGRFEFKGIALQEAVERGLKPAISWRKANW
jgi:hypothetical protein